MINSLTVNDNKLVINLVDVIKVGNPDTIITKFTSVQNRFDQADIREQLRLLLYSFKLLREFKCHTDQFISTYKSQCSFISNTLEFAGRKIQNSNRVLRGKSSDPYSITIMPTTKDSLDLISNVSTLVNITNAFRTVQAYEHWFKIYCRWFVDASWKLITAYGNIPRRKRDKSKVVVYSLSLLKAIVSPREVWNGSKCDFHHEHGIHGYPFYSAGKFQSVYNGLMKGLKYKDRTTTNERISITLGESVFNMSINHDLYDPYRVEDYKHGIHYRSGCYADASRSHSRVSKVVYGLVYNQRYKSYIESMKKRLIGIGVPSNEFVYNMFRYRAKYRLGSRALTKLAELRTITTPYVGTVITSKPETVGQCRVQNETVNILRFKCFVASEDMRECFAIALERSASLVVNDIIKSVDWYHTESLVWNDTTSTNVTDLMQSRIDWQLKRKPKTEAELRKERAAYARKLIRLQRVNMLDSQSCGNCHPGTIEFCKAIGLQLPELAYQQFISFAIDSRKLLRLWKAKGYLANNLFYKLIDNTYDRLMKQTVLLTAYY